VVQNGTLQNGTVTYGKTLKNGQALQNGAALQNGTLQKMAIPTHNVSKKLCAEQ
jgi:hypothetical protein